MGLNPVIGILVIDSTPPAMKASPAPMEILPAASWIACMEDPQKRFIVTPGTVSGRSVRNVIILATLKPCSASGKAVPTIRSSIRLGSTPVSLIRPLTTAAAMSSGLVLASSPLFAGVNGDLAYPAITAGMLIHAQVQ